jgi:hypothetical protein
MNLKNYTRFSYIILFILSSLFLYLIPIYYSRDINSYKIFYDHSLANLSNFDQIWNFFYYEPLFKFLFIKLSKYIFFYDFFFLIGFVCLSIKSFLLYKNEKNIFLGIFLYFLLFFSLQHEASQIRTAIATTFILVAIFSKIKFFFFYFFLTIAGILFHKVCIIILAIYSLRSFVLSLVVIFFISIFSDKFITIFLPYIDLSSYLTVEAQNILFNTNVKVSQVSLKNSLVWSTTLVCIIIILSDYKNLNFIQKKSLMLMVLGIFIYFSFRNVPDIASRFFEVSSVGIVSLLASKKLSFKKSWIFVYFLVYYIICYNTYIYSHKIIFYEEESTFKLH